TIPLHHDHEEDHLIPSANVTAPQRALAIDRERSQVNRKVLWGRAQGSRYCPKCLAERGGRWLLSWRLGWSFACVRHHCLLADNCPACLHRLRERRYVWSAPVDPGHCSAPAPGVNAGRGTARRAADLTAVDPMPLAADHPALRAAALVQQVIERDHADFGLYADDPQQARAVLSDLRTLAARALAYTTRDQLAARIPEDLMTAYDHARTQPRRNPHNPPRRRSARPGFMAPPHAAEAAVGLTPCRSCSSRQSSRQDRRCVSSPRSVATEPHRSRPTNSHNAATASPGF
ncbi:TniQ family protein, partial [Streptomyces sp. NPDC057438]|uniref:TniQ family protein n=1 Tax=Streptomyces sp. NPDC057438 TaxID=3346133 RepID=UPI0036B639FB